MGTVTRIEECLDMDDDGLNNDPLGGIDYGPCNDFAPDSLGDDPKVCIACFYHEEYHTPEARALIIETIAERIRDNKRIEKERSLHKITVVKITIIEVAAEDYSNAVDRIRDGMGDTVSEGYVSLLFYNEIMSNTFTETAGY